MTVLVGAGFDWKKNRQRQRQMQQQQQMRGFFPFGYAQGQNDRLCVFGMLRDLRLRSKERLGLAYDFF
jgi:hypothetical protein